MIGVSCVIEKIHASQPLTHEEVTALLSTNDTAVWNTVYACADLFRKKYMGDAVHLRGLLEFSNYCIRECAYCGLRSHNINQVRYRMKPEEIIDQAIRINTYGIKTVVMQSGEDPFFTTEILCDIVREIKSKADTAITLSVGEKTFEEYAALRTAGADRYLLRHETASPELYNKLHPDSRFEDRIRCIENLFKTGFQVGIGSMVGLPGQDETDLAKDILLLQKYQPDMIGIGPFIANPETPLGNDKSGTIEMTLRMVALARIVCPKAHIPATTATGSIDPLGREKALRVGANVVMPNFTPQHYKIHYTIYPNKRCLDEEGSKCNGCIRAMIHNEGRTVSTDYGHAYRLTHNQNG
ncbi:MAG: [FeFe] hydrogenase H-cluster radical SAM maturase HydE [Candidatus Auribacterota bacterium]